MPRWLCTPCSHSLCHNWMLQCALANRTFIGNVPEVLKNLTFVEESAIALCCAKAYIVQLKGDSIDGSALPNLQWGMRPHNNISSESTHCCQETPAINWGHHYAYLHFVCWCNCSFSRAAKKKSKLLGDRVRATLLWLKEHNPLYRDVELDESAMGDLDQTSFLLFHIKHVLPSQAQSSLQSRYNTLDPKVFTAGLEGTEPEEIPFQSVVITDVNGHPHLMN